MIWRATREAENEAGSLRSARRVAHLRLLSEAKARLCPCLAAAQRLFHFACTDVSPRLKKSEALPYNSHLPLFREITLVAGVDRDDGNNGQA